MLSASQTPTPDAQKARSHRRGASPPQFDPTNGGLTAFLLGLLFGDGGGLLDLHLAPCALKNDWIFWRYGRNVRAREGRSSSPSWRRRRILERHDPASAAHLLPRMETTKVCQLLNSRRLDWDTYLPLIPLTYRFLNLPSSELRRIGRPRTTLRGIFIIFDRFRHLILPSPGP